MATNQVVKQAPKELEVGLEKLRGEVKAIVVKTPEQYESAGKLLVAIRNYQKDVKNKLNPFVDIARRALDEARQEMNKYLNAATMLEDQVSGPMADFKRAEREAAEAEQRRINEERRIEAARLAEEQRKRDEAEAAEARKQREREIAEAQKAGDLKKREAERLRKEAEERERQQREQAAKDAQAAAANVQEVKVAPSTPTIAGLRGRVNWKFRIVNAGQVNRHFCKPDEVTIGAFVRNCKDKAKAEAAIGGIECYTEDTI